MKTKKIISLVLLAAVVATSLASCSGDKNEATKFKTSKSISVVSREDGSGTRGAFIELFGIEEKVNDTKVDHTTKDAIIANKTDIVLTNVSSDTYAIGYVSLGSLNNTVKAMKIDGVEATADNVKNDSYKISRPFNIATKGEATGLAKDFIDFILSAEGQDVVSSSYIKVNESAAAYSGSKPAGKIVVAGSSSVSPIMEKLREAYLKINTTATIEIQSSDSSTGIKAVMDGTCDIGMASRELKDSEKPSLKGIQIAIDGVAVITNPACTADALTSEQVKNIFTGAVTNWDEIIK